MASPVRIQVRSAGYNYWAFDDEAVCNAETMGGMSKIYCFENP